jgi:hypothetical protein
LTEGKLKATVQVKNNTDIEHFRKSFDHYMSILYSSYDLKEDFDETNSTYTFITSNEVSKK